MGLSFANPAALWVLAALPAVVLLHYLQSRERKEKVSTLFLLDVLPEETRRGAVFTRLLAGPQLWCQLLAVILFALLLARPMWLRRESVQTVAVVVDVSASMRAFLDRAPEILRRNLEPLSRAAGRTEWLVLPSDTAEARLYAGPDLERALQSILAAPFLRGPHDPAPALRQARLLAGGEGAAIWITDHPPPPTETIAPIGVGLPSPNSGITGVQVDPDPDGARWEATLLHRGTAPVVRRLDLVVNGKTLSSQEKTLAPGAIVRVTGRLPPDADRGELRLTDDPFDLDNRHPFVVPPTPDLSYAVELRGDSAAWAHRVTSTLPGARTHNNPQPATDNPQPTTLNPQPSTPNPQPETRNPQPSTLNPQPATTTPFALWRPASDPPPEPVAPAEILVLTGGPEGEYHPPVAEDHPLVRDLAWDGLLALPRQRDPINGEQVLVWMDSIPLVSLLPHEGGDQLLLNFDPENSNAERWPAAVLLVHRYLRSRVRASVTRRVANLETLQTPPALPRPRGPLAETFVPLRGDPVQRRLSTLPARAPARPGWWTLTADDTPLLDAAIAFGAMEETDLSSAATRDLPRGWVAARRERNSERDFLRPWLFALLAFALVGSWLYGSKPGVST